MSAANIFASTPKKKPAPLAPIAKSQSISEPNSNGPARSGNGDGAVDEANQTLRHSPAHTMRQAQQQFPEIADTSFASPIKRKEEKGSITCGTCLKVREAALYTLYNLRRRIASKRRCNECLEKERKKVLREHKTEFSMAVKPTRTAHEAVAEGNMFALHKLHKAGVVRTTARDPKTGRSILSEAVLKGDAFMAEYLVDNGADASLRSYLGAETPLHFAVLGGSLECMDLLIVHGAEPNARNKAGQTPLHLAKTVEIAEFLISHSCRDDVEDHLKRTPYTVAVQDGNTKLARFLSNRLLEQKKRDQARTKALRQRRADRERQVRSCCTLFLRQP